MKPPYYIAAILLLFAYTGLYAQHTKIKPLPVNYKVPAVALHLVNSKQSTAMLNSFSSKLLILDFWSTGCTSCIHHFSQLDSIQQLYKNDICILPVSCAATGDTKRIVQRFITGYKQRINEGFSLASVVDDAVLDKLFPHATIPDFVWINKGKYVTHTGSDEVTVANIMQVLNGKPLDVFQKTDTARFNTDQPLVSYLGSRAANMLGSSTLTNSISGLISSLGLTRSTSAGTKLYVINLGLIQLFKLAYAGMGYLPLNQVVYTGHNHLLLNSINSNTDDTTQQFCYELAATGTPDSLMFNRMQQDLSFYFKISGHFKTQQTNSLVMQVADSNLIPVGNGIDGNSLYDQTTGARVVTNEPLSFLTERLNASMPMPVIDETGVTGNINLQLPNDLNDIMALTASLKQQGISLKQEERAIPILTLTDE